MSRSRNSGFTLIEMAVVLVIIGYLLTTLLMPSGGQADYKKRLQTETDLVAIQDALLGFAAANGRLPCPADPTIADGLANAGQEALNLPGAPLPASATNCACGVDAAGVATRSAAVGGAACQSSTVSGVLPWATLGVPEMDGWNHRYTYHLTSCFGRGAGNTTSQSPCTAPANAVPPSVTAPLAGFQLADNGVLAVYSDASAATAIVTGQPAVVVSHGRQAFGAWQGTGRQVAAPAMAAAVDCSGGGQNTANLCESWNWGNGNIRNNGTPTANDVLLVSNPTSDDLLVWIATPTLMNRLIIAKRLP